MVKVKSIFDRLGYLTQDKTLELACF